MATKTKKIRRKAQATARAPTPPQIVGPRGRGRPALHEEAWTKATVVLMERQIVMLDRLCADIRAKTGRAMKRAEIIRALVDGFDKSGLDVTAVQSEQDLVKLIAQRLKH